MQKKRLWYGLLGLGGLLVLAVVFGAGILLGRVSVRPAPRPLNLLRSTSLPFIGGHGVLGTLKDVSEQTLTIESRNGTTQLVLVDKNTRLDRNRQRITLNDLKTGEQIVVIGSPNAQRQVVAKWVLVLPAAADPTGKRRTPTPSEFK